MSLKDSDSRKFIQSRALSDDFAAKFTGKCADCWRKIRKGDLIHEVSDGFAHANCNAVKRPEKAGYGRRTGASFLRNGTRRKHKL